ncbi:unnamed protein product [Schistosoma rodhaini]|uniref:Cadherin domain-containing protein n=1 Tax=Schistosoma rodhaini TaxID=6188 RepID=A0AA85FZX3_9TREM|nr:unnamed protein product [Schistosoma rodhaini]
MNINFKIIFKLYLIIYLINLILIKFQINYEVKSINIDYINNTTYNVFSNNESLLEYQIQFYLNDNTPLNYLVGNILTTNYTHPHPHPHLHPHHPHPHQQQLQQHGNIFIRSMLIPDTYYQLTIKGDLYTRNVIDRDLICSKFNCCLLNYCQMNIEGYLFTINNLKPIKFQIQIIIIDENDNIPLFPKSIINTDNNHGNNTNEHSNNTNKHSNNTNNENLIDIYNQNLNIYELIIPESISIGKRYSLPMAIDKDSPRYGIKQYRLQIINHLITNQISNDSYTSSIESPFSLINPDQLIINKINTKSIIGSPQLQVDYMLDREKQSIYYYRIIVEDHGEPPLYSDMILRIKVADINDNAPIFINFTTDITTVNHNDNNNNIFIMENLTIGTKIFQFYTKDLDEGENGNITYLIDWKSIYGGWDQSNIQSIISKYSLNPWNGELIISDLLDYENELERKLILLIQAIDNGIPKLTSSISYTIHLIDINDNEPEIEMIPIHTTEISNSSSNSSSSIGNVSQFPLLYENDPTPQLLRLISINDKDDCSINKIQCQLINEERNLVSFRLISYSNYAYGLFNQRQFDYEKDTNKKGQLLVGIQCEDIAEPKKFIQKWFELPLGDLNDNWPQFNQLNYEFSIYENVPIYTKIGYIVAMDLDSGIYGQLRYELMSDHLEYLKFIQIDATNGTIYTTDHLDRELINILHLFVTVKDGGVIADDDDDDDDGGGGGGGDGGYDNRINNETGNFKSIIKTNTTSIKIHLLDVNDNPPKYNGSLEFHIEENLPLGTIILNQLNFIDPDLGENSTISIKLIDQSYSYLPSISDELNSNYGNEMNDNSMISVDNQSRLVVSGVLDREKQTQFMIKLIAYDHGKLISHTCTTTLTFYIDDINDNQPYLLYPNNGSLLFGMSKSSNWLNSHQSTSSMIPVDTSFGTLIATIRGKDLDAGDNGTVIYSIIPSKIYHLKQKLKQQQNIINMKVNNRNLIDPFENTNSRSNLKINENKLKYEIDKNTDFLELYDGFFYFTIHEQTGQLTTSWNNHLKKKEIELFIKNQSIHINELQLRDQYLKSKGTPIPGLYIITIHLQDKGKPQQTTEVIFYINITEPIRDSFGFWALHHSHISNKIILILIIICSLTLIISLTIVILWIRFKSDNQILRSISNTSCREYKQGIIITSDTQNYNKHYKFHHSINLSPMIDRKYEKSSNRTIFLPSTVLESYPNELPSSEGLYNGTLLTETMITTSIDEKLPSYIQPYYSDENTNQLSINVYPFHVNEQNESCHHTTEWMSTTTSNQYHTKPYQPTSFIIKHSNEPIPNIIHMDSFADKIDLYNKDVQLLNNGMISVNLTNITNQTNSIYGSDSGVDSGTGIIITTSDTYLPISSWYLTDLNNKINYHDSIYGSFKLPYEKSDMNNISHGNI